MSYPDYRPIAAKCKPNTLWRLGAADYFFRMVDGSLKLKSTVEGEIPSVYI